MSTATEILIALGAYRYSIDTAAPQEMDRVTTYRWADLPIVDHKPVSQYIGKDLDRITMRGVIYPFHKGGFDQVKSMRLEADKGTPLRLIAGTGQDLGLWTIRKITERSKMLFVKGVPRKIEFDIELMEYANAS